MERELKKLASHGSSHHFSCLTLERHRSVGSGEHEAGDGQHAAAGDREATRERAGAGEHEASAAGLETAGGGSAR